MVAIVALVVVWPLSAGAIEYTFTKIADNTGPLSGPFTDPAISNDGTVVSLDIGLNLIFTGQGGEIVLGDYTIIASGSGPFTFFGIPTINASNIVAFGGSLDIGGAGIFTGQGGETVIGDYAKIADTNDPFAAFASSSAFINDSGTVAFRAFPDTGGEGIFIGNGGSITTIAVTTGPFSDFGGPLGFPSINSSATVAFEADLDAGGSGIFTGFGGETTLGDYTTIADTGGPISQLFNGFGTPIINDNDTVVFFIVLNSGRSGIFTGSGGETNINDYITIADTNDPYSGFFLSPSINNVGTVAFHAFLDAGGEGIFTGPDPVADKVIANGDPLFGSTVVGQSFGPQGINDFGQLTFIASLADGRSVIVRADPPSGFLEFPFLAETPWTAPISSVHDHNVKTDKDGVPLYYRNDLNGVVEPYTGLPGFRKCGVGNCVQRFGFVRGYKNENGEQFFLDGDITYTGGGGCEVQKSPVDCHFWLFYDGHPGYDYPAALGTPIIAPADGFLFVPASDPITSRGDPEGAEETFHIMAIDHGNGFSTWYLHVGREAGTEGAPPEEQDFRGIMAGETPIFVEQGAEIGQVGNKGLCTIEQGQCSPGLAHLHFEVRTGVSGFLCELPECQVVDPYGPSLRLWLDEPPP